MTKHNFKMLPAVSRIGVCICCLSCKDPEPSTDETVWIDEDGTVYFESPEPAALIAFLARHDAFKLTEGR
jgi:hypothetical protein